MVGCESIAYAFRACMRNVRAGFDEARARADAELEAELQQMPRWERVKRDAAGAIVLEREE